MSLPSSAKRMEYVGIVVRDLAAATAFFVELGLKLQGEGHDWYDGLTSVTRLFCQCS